MEFAKALELFTALDRESVEYILVGGLAVNFHGLIRATQDIALFVRPHQENVERLKRALTAVWSDPEIAGIRLDDLAGDYPTIRYGPPGEDFTVDLIGRLGSAFTFEDLEAENLTVQGVLIRIATPQTLVRMKKDTLRELDRMDAAMIREHFDLPEE